MVIDKSNMKQVLLDFPKQCREALSLAKGIKVQGKINRIVVIGMGGSGICGDLLKVVMADSTVPVDVVKDYHIPKHVNDESLVFAVSYSGNTEETLAGVIEAKNRNAKIIAISSGGQISDMADNVIKIPSGLQPRNAVAYLFFPMVGVLFNSGLYDIKNVDLNEMIKIVSDTEYFEEKSRDLAKKIRNKIPIIYSSTNMEPIAYRFKCEINENSKLPAFNNVFPEMCHNELVAYQGMERSRYMVILIRNNEDHDRIKKRMDICKDLFEERIDVEEVHTMGDSVFARMFSLIYLGDWTSYHLAIWERVDPTPVYVIENLKNKMKE